MMTLGPLLSPQSWRFYVWGLVGISPAYVILRICQPTIVISNIQMGFANVLAVSIMFSRQKVAVNFTKNGNILNGQRMKSMYAKWSRISLTFVSWSGFLGKISELTSLLPCLFGSGLSTEVVHVARPN